MNEQFSKIILLNDFKQRYEAEGLRNKKSKANILFSEKAKQRKEKMLLVSG